MSSQAKILPCRPFNDLKDKDELVMLSFFNIATLSFVDLDKLRTEFLRDCLSNLGKQADILSLLLACFVKYHLPNGPDAASWLDFPIKIHQSQSKTKAVLFNPEQETIPLPLEAATSPDENFFECLASMQTPQREWKVGEKGTPFFMFEVDYVPTCPVDDAIKNFLHQKVDPNWTKKFTKTGLVPFIDKHVEDKKMVATGLFSSFSRADQEACVRALTYYVCDARGKWKGSLRECPYSAFNGVSFGRNIDPNHQVWSYYLHKGLSALSPVACMTYRGSSKQVTKVSDQYKEGNHICWISFTSISRQSNVAEEFATSDGYGTMFEIAVLDGRDVVPFEILQEAELILLPNSIFVVESVVQGATFETIKMKQLTPQEAQFHN